MDSLKLLLSQNQRDRIIKEASAQNRSGDPNLPRHTIYQGDRKIQQLGGEIIENGIVLNNQSLAIGDVVMPLAKGNVLRRVDNTNGGALLGTAYRDAVENDIDANGNRRDSALSRNGGNEPSTPVNPNPINPSTHPIFSPPFGCTPPPPKCFWTTNPTPPDGFQSHGSAVVNENAVPLYLHCTIGSAVPKNLNCSFLNKWKCVNGVCTLSPDGNFDSQAECEAVCGVVFIEVCFSATAPISYAAPSDKIIVSVSQTANSLFTYRNAPPNPGFSPPSNWFDTGAVIAADKKSFTSNWDSFYGDNSGVICKLIGLKSG